MLCGSWDLHHLEQHCRITTTTGQLAWQLHLPAASSLFAATSLCLLMWHLPTHTPYRKAREMVSQPQVSNHLSQHLLMDSSTPPAEHTQHVACLGAQQKKLHRVCDMIYSSCWYGPMMHAAACSCLHSPWFPTGTIRTSGEHVLQLTTQATIAAAGGLYPWNRHRSGMQPSSSKQHLPQLRHCTSKCSTESHTRSGRLTACGRPLTQAAQAIAATSHPTSRGRLTAGHHGMVLFQLRVICTHQFHG